jgi:uncharacterized repeat protein (TIGR01451 family)
MLSLLWLRRLRRIFRGLMPPLRPSFRPRMEELEPRVVLNGGTTIVTNTNSSGFGSLSGAISYANSNPGTTITFNIAGVPGTPPVISLTQALPSITQAVIINGYNAPTADNVVIDGTMIPGSDGLDLVSGASGSTIAGLVIDNFQPMTTMSTTGSMVTSGGNGILIAGGVSGCTIQNDLIGVDSTGTTAQPNAVGITVLGSSNTIADSIISGNSLGSSGQNVYGNAGTGIFIHDGAVGTGGNNNRIQGNRIGLAADGKTALPNTNNGIEISNAYGNVIGGTTAGARNYISGNSAYGVKIDGALQPNFVLDNFIGTDVTGTTAVPNGMGGIYAIGPDKQGELEPVTIAGNVISGNTGDGLKLLGLQNSVISGNSIGVASNGTALGNSADGIYLANSYAIPPNSYSAAIGLNSSSYSAANVISANGGDGIDLVNVQNSIISGNLIGVAGDGRTSLGNSGNGINLRYSSSNLIGSGNVISGNSGDGVAILGPNSGTGSNIVQGNFIGADISGSQAVPNGNDGVDLAFSSGNTVGGTSPGARNIISGNNRDGVEIAFGTSNLVEGNFIGTNVGGTGALANGVHGISERYTNYTSIGGATAGAGNVISGNAYDGVYIDNSTSPTVQGNWIGTITGGTAALGNGQNGVEIVDVGDPPTITDNVISGNGSNGILLGLNIADSIISGNLIGVASDGRTALGNGANGISLHGASYNKIGVYPVAGGSAGAPNVIASNGGYGVFISRYYYGDGKFSSAKEDNLVAGNSIGTDASASLALGNAQGGVGINDSYGNTISANSIFSNANSGINLVPSGQSNNLLPAPTISSVTITGNTVTINWSEDAAVSPFLPGDPFQIEFFSNTVPGPNNTGEGQFFLGSVSVPLGSGGTVSGTATFTLSSFNALTFTATATDTSTGDTSEFSNAVTAPTADLGVALAVSNATPVVGTTISYTVTLTNLGPNDANSIVVSAPLPTGLQFVSSAGAGSYDPTSGQWTLSSLTTGSSTSLVIQALVQASAAGTTLTGQATISASTPFDPNPANNTATITLTPQPLADVSVEQSVTPDPVRPGGALTFTITVSNVGPNAASGVQLTDPLPAGTSLVSFTAPTGCTITQTTGSSGTTIIATLTSGTLAVGASVQFSLVVGVSRTAANASVIANTATVSATTADPDTTNNSSTASATVLIPPVPPIPPLPPINPTIPPASVVQVLVPQVSSLEVATAEEDTKVRSPDDLPPEFFRLSFLTFSITDLVITTIPSDVTIVQPTRPSSRGNSTGIITGRVFEDTNGDGLWQSDELPLEGMAVYLDIGNTGEYDESQPIAYTDNNGQFSFIGLAPGTYTVRVVPHRLFSVTSPVEGAAKVVVAADGTAAITFGVKPVRPRGSQRTSMQPPAVPADTGEQTVATSTDGSEAESTDVDAEP